MIAERHTVKQWLNIYLRANKHVFIVAFSEEITKSNHPVIALALQHFAPDVLFKCVFIAENSFIFRNFCEEVYYDA